MPIFKLDSVGLPELDEVAIGLCVEYKAILKPVKPSKGDADGRKKLLNRKELAYVWFMSDYKSDGVKGGYDDNRLYEYAVREADLPAGWKPYAEIEQAIERYRNDRDTVIVRLNKSLLRGLNDSNDTVELLQSLVRDKLNDISRARLSNDTTVNVTETLGELIAFRKELILISKELPAQIKMHQEYEELLKTENENIRLAMGGGEVPNSAL